ncbi:MAG: efflux transporter outer membrane subunit [Kiritimatiellales bacterium]
MNMNRFFATLGVALLLGGCTLTPQYNRPPAPVPAELPPAASRLSPETPAAADLTWQEFFTDPKLQQVIAIALDNNRDLRLAALNVERARALYGIQRAELLPSINASGSGSKQGIPAALSSSGNAMTVEQYSVNLGVASWEIDLFGRIRSLKKRALQQYLATDEARRGTQIALVSSVAGAYLTLAADLENLQLAQSTLHTQQNAYDLIQNQVDAGVATELDLRRSLTQVDTARGELARYTQLIAQDQNALNLLAGMPVAGELLPDTLADIIPPAEISAGLSSDVLLSRPDIIAAEHQLKAAYAYIGAARAAFFPRISLTASIGTASDELTDLFGAGSDAWNFAPQIVLPIFDARTWAAYRVSKADREIALTQYEKTIQTAFRDVADSLAVLGTVEQQVAAQQAVVDSAQRIYELSEQRYSQGIDGYLGVLDAQRSLYAAQQGLTYLRLSRLANQVQLYAALGGGTDPQSDRLKDEKNVERKTVEPDDEIGRNSDCAAVSGRGA